jgi:hypothetical protein
LRSSENRLGASSYVPLAKALDRAAEELGIDYIAGFSALVEKGITSGDSVLLESIPEALATTNRVCSSINVATTRAGINMDAIALMGHVIRSLAQATADRGGIGCAKLVTFANMPEDNPFVAGANHGIGEGDLTLNVGRQRSRCRAVGAASAAGVRRPQSHPHRRGRDDQAHVVQGHPRRRANRPRGRASGSAARSGLASSICRWPRRRQWVTAWPRSSKSWA